MIDKTMCEVLWRNISDFYVNLRVEDAAVSRNRYGLNLHRNRRYFVIKLHTWFCLSYFLKTNIKFYCIYQYCMSINSFFNTVSVSRFQKKNCWDLLIWVTGHCNRAAVSRNRYGVEKTVDTHKILINAIKFYVFTFIFLPCEVSVF
jgi:hypothetical protein